MQRAQDQAFESGHTRGDRAEEETGRGRNRTEGGQSARTGRQSGRPADRFSGDAEEMLSAWGANVMDYGRENPGKMTLIVFGVGVGVGLLLAGGVASTRDRRSRIAEPVINALSNLAYEFIR